MMGANWQSNSRFVVTKKFAWRPVRTNSGKLVWGKGYVNVKRSVQGPGSRNDNTLVWNECYTLHEYFIKKLSE